MAELTKFKKINPDLIETYAVLRSLEDFLHPDINDPRWEDMSSDNRREARRYLEGTASFQGDPKPWLGVSGGYEEVLEMRSTGWKHGVKKMEEYLSKMPPAPKAVSFRRKRKYSDAGQLDVNKYLNGATEDLFLKHERRKVRGQTAVGVTRIGIHGGVTCTVEADKYFWRGVAACLIASSLESAGRPVEIFVYYISTDVWSGLDYSRRWVVEAPVKPAGVPINLDMLAYTTALPGVFRTIGFAYKFLTSGERTVSGNLGTSVMEAPPSVEEGSDLIVSGDINSEEKALDMVNKFIGFMSYDDEEITVLPGLGYR